jgi:hypothetical protein
MSSFGYQGKPPAHDDLGPHANERRTVKPHSAARGTELPANNLEQGALPCTISSQHTDHGAPRDLEGHPAQRERGAIGGLNLLDVKHRLLSSRFRRAAEIGFPDGGQSPYSLRSAFGNRPTMVQNMDAITQAHDEAHIVVDHEQAATDLGADLPQRLEEDVALCVIEPRTRLIEQEERRIGAERARDLEQTSLTVRERPRVHVRSLRESNPTKSRHRHVPRLAPRELTNGDGGSFNILKNS